MKKTKELNEIWVKASIIGTFWAASEIVIGSFLHNLKIPFSGNILAAFAIILLISFSYVWKDKGLFWRAGIICALMKTISPSAVIFGPMIAIIAQAFILEISVRTLGRNAVAFAIGAMLAMSWNLFQKIFSYIILYGFNIVEVYLNLLNYAQKQLNINVDIVWAPIIILLALYAIMGLFAAFIGIYSGRKIAKGNNSLDYKLSSKQSDLKWGKSNNDFNYSLLWLLTNALLMTGALILLNFAAWYIWLPSFAFVITVWIHKYKSVLKRLSKPKFWIVFFIITMIVAIAFSGFSLENIYSGLFIGIKMNFRAVLILLGFSVMGTELYNPRIRNLFAQSYFRNLPVALELSFESLPQVIANRPDYKTFWRKPFIIINQIIGRAEDRLEEINNRGEIRVFIISGSIHSGKTYIIKKIIAKLYKIGINTGGFISEKKYKRKKVVGYDIVKIQSKEKEVFLRLEGDSNNDRIGKYFLYQQGITKGIDAIDDAIANECDVIVMDEVGLLELEDKVWASKLKEVLSLKNIALVISVRESYVNSIIEKYNINKASIFDTKNGNIGDIVNEIAAKLPQLCN